MAYKTEELIKKALEVVEKHNLFFIEDVVAYLPCSRQTFYTHNLDKLESLKELLDANRINAKVKMRKKWSESDNATLQIALYQLIATDEENSKINSQRIETEHSFKGSALKIGFDDSDKDQA